MPVSELSIRATRLGLDQRLITVAGELDLHSVDPLRCELETVIGEADADVVVDLREAGLFDSIALGILANAASRLRQQGRGLAVVADDEVLASFGLTGLDRVISLRRTVADASGQRL
ncbi:MAG: STAS domain-containing protein [Gaiellaceae bacterium]